MPRLGLDDGPLVVVVEGELQDGVITLAQLAVHAVDTDHHKFVAVDRDTTLMIGGSGDVIEPTDGVIGIGSGGVYATTAARALIAHTDLPPEKVVEQALTIAADICVYSNKEITAETLG